MLVLLIIILLLLFFQHQSNDIVVTTYEINQSKSKSIKNGYKIVQLSDLHSKVFNSNNWKLVHKIKEIKPDLIVVTGDMINSIDQGGEVFLNIAKQLKTDYKILYVEGNHELTAKYDTLNQKNNGYNQYLEQLSSMGVTILRNEYLKVNELLIVGVTVPLSYYRSVPEHIQTLYHKFEGNESLDFLKYSNQDLYRVVLCHNPFYIEKLEPYSVDLVLSGHIHGGIVRIPYIGGLLSPERKFFPKFSGGLYTIKNMNMIVNRGLGNSSLKLRIFNKPEITVVTLINDIS